MSSSPASNARRHLLAAAGGATALLLTGASRAQVARSDVPAPACVLTPAQTEGPYFVDDRLDRTDIRVDPSDGSTRPGALLALTLRVASVDGGGCVPLVGAIVDIWHCDAKGVYSDTNDTSFRTRGSKFLRGYQASDADGRVHFTTIYPGAYPGRAVHIHFKVRTKTGSALRDFTSQLYFDDALTDRVHARDPYAGSGERRTRNARDGLYRQGGQALQLVVGETAEGYAAAYDVGVRGV
jgi:protocatechuate 3,4-dioxygenase beta subunit